MKSLAKASLIIPFLIIYMLSVNYVYTYAHEITHKTVFEKFGVNESDIITVITPFGGETKVKGNVTYESDVYKYQILVEIIGYQLYPLYLVLSLILAAQVVLLIWR